MELFLKIALAGVLVLLIIRMWPAAKHWMENGPRAERGDWNAALIPLGLVVGFVILLILMVRG
jgi:archaellum biogenesis protein FlaJ (TadC family)